MRIAVVGASGFVGSALVQGLEECGHDVVSLELPRFGATDTAEIRAVIERYQLPKEILDQLETVDVVINAAGNPGATSGDQASLNGANAVLPGVLANACADLNVGRLVHVSTAAVQGSKPTLDSSWDYHAVSPYAISKMFGEKTVRCSRLDNYVIYRPPGVHARGRSTTDSIARLASSPFAVVPRGVDAPSPQTTLQGVVAAIVFLATSDQVPPTVVHHPSEGITTRSILRILGRREPRELPQSLARIGVSILSVLGKASGWAAGQARRLEVLWFGQRQADSWLSSYWDRNSVVHNAWDSLGEGDAR